MTIVTLSAAGDATPAEAWDRYADPARWSQWAPHIMRVDCDEPRLVTGMTGRVVGPLGVAVDFVVDEADHVARTWAWTVHLGPIPLVLHHAVRSDPRGMRDEPAARRARCPSCIPYAPVARYALGRLVAA